MGSPCEASFLSSNPDIKVRVLCSPTSLSTIRSRYNLFNVTVEPLEINQSDLNTKRMLDLKAVTQENGPVPLYLHTIYRILRQMRMEQQAIGGSFNYIRFKWEVEAAELNPTQRVPLNRRLDTLESFMPAFQTQILLPNKCIRNRRGRNANDWTPQHGHLTIVDLSCPCVTPEGACSLFNICLSIFLEQNMTTGRVIALDEAHKVGEQISSTSDRGCRRVADNMLSNS